MKKNSTQAVDTRRHGLLDANLATAEHTKGNVTDPPQEEYNVKKQDTFYEKPLPFSLFL
jgi:hypothetical protein